MDSYQELGRRLREARERTGLTQDQVAKAVGVVREQMSYYETGTREIDLVRLTKLADLYGFSLSYLLAGQSKGEQRTLSVAFRAGEIADEDMPVIAWVQRFIRNISELNYLLKKDERHE